jgi:hypothetical protein
MPLPMGYREGEGEWGRTISLGGEMVGGGGAEVRFTWSVFLFDMANMYSFM